MNLKWLSATKVLCFFIVASTIWSSIEGRAIKQKGRTRRKDACPKGHYFDQESSRCKKVPCGGTVIHTDTKRRCSGRFLGIKVHPKYQQYYYICKPKSVVFVKCPENQLFNTTISHCIEVEKPDKPVLEKSNDCKRSGRFPTNSNCSLYYICSSDGQKYVKKVMECPKNMVYNPNTQRCSCSHKCIPTKISPDDYFDDYDAETFPPCKRPGRFRSPTDCSLYYTCSAKVNGKFYQTRYRCPAGTLYDIEKEKCNSKHHVKCEFVTIEDIIDEYDKTHKYNVSDVSEESAEFIEAETQTTLSTLAPSSAVYGSTISSIHDDGFETTTNDQITQSPIDSNTYEGNEGGFLITSENYPNIDNSDETQKIKPTTENGITQDDENRPKLEPDDSSTSTTSSSFIEDSNGSETISYDPSSSIEATVTPASSLDPSAATVINTSIEETKSPTPIPESVEETSPSAAISIEINENGLASTTEVSTVEPCKKRDSDDSICDMDWDSSTIHQTIVTIDGKSESATYAGKSVEISAENNNEAVTSPSISTQCEYNENCDKTTEQQLTSTQTPALAHETDAELVEDPTPMTLVPESLQIQTTKPISSTEAPSTEEGSLTTNLITEYPTTKRIDPTTERIDPTTERIDTEVPPTILPVSEDRLSPSVEPDEDKIIEIKSEESISTLPSADVIIIANKIGKQNYETVTESPQDEKQKFSVPDDDEAPSTVSTYQATSTENYLETTTEATNNKDVSFEMDDPSKDTNTIITKTPFEATSDVETSTQADSFTSQTASIGDYFDTTSQATNNKTDTSFDMEDVLDDDQDFDIDPAKRKDTTEIPLDENGDKISTSNADPLFTTSSSDSTSGEEKQTTIYTSTIDGQTDQSPTSKDSYLETSSILPENEQTTSQTNTLVTDQNTWSQNQDSTYATVKDSLEEKQTTVSPNQFTQSLSTVKDSTESVEDTTNKPVIVPKLDNNNEQSTDTPTTTTPANLQPVPDVTSYPYISVITPDPSKNSNHSMDSNSDIVDTPTTNLPQIIIDTGNEFIGAITEDDRSSMEDSATEKSWTAITETTKTIPDDETKEPTQEPSITKVTSAIIHYHTESVEGNENDQIYGSSTSMPPAFHTDIPQNSVETTQQSIPSEALPESPAETKPRSHVNTQQVSLLHLEDKSVETLNVHISKPMKLLLHFRPKFSCDQCQKDGKPSDTSDEHTKDPKTIHLRF